MTDKPGKMIVFASDEATMEQAFKELCQTKEYVCFTPKKLKMLVYELERRKK